ncbi:50S ribosomal protein L4 [Caldibacillus thermoamylovorans]|uniref:50S ribosomal protein L4 n=1 Tax=Caldibacillus thermoamylovorans TaxID=35841 RepID=UPI00203C1195|nr:50S ribosomal protein L4 [Caldibacillus thermoamylovorans]MCM3799150.1 50S ribosomal protein L4 [Caldibacillus thermoamylovorans]
MPKVTVYNQAGSQVGEIELNDSVFGIEPNKHVMSEVIISLRASQRQGTAKVKNRSEVRGGGRKPWRQKGTGRARQGSIRAPQWRGGGTVFGPVPRSYAYKFPKKVRRLALKSALSTKVQENNIVILDQLTFEAPKTKDFVTVLKNLSVDTKALIVTSDTNENAVLSARNIPGVKVVSSNAVNVLDIIGHEKLIMTEDAARKVEEVLA